MLTPLKNPPPISAQTLRENFGSTSQIFREVKRDLEFFWAEVEDEPDAKSIRDNWSGTIKTLYGYKSDTSLFLDHTYLNILARIVVYLTFTNAPHREEISDVLSGKYFGITSFSPDDFALWVLNTKIKDKSLSLFWSLCQELARYAFSKIDEDIFREIYEEMVERKERHKVGEYYTPEWLVELILTEVLSLWEEKGDRAIPKIIDPACGSGTFLYRAVRILIDKGASLRDITKNVAGIDINPMATIIAKANYLIAISKLIKDSQEVALPIYTRDCLKTPDLFELDRKIEKYDIIIGNPPWVVMRSMRNREYQNFLKKEVLKYHLLENRDVHLFTQMELATLFFCKCADLYLKRNGIIAFVMPRSVIAGTIHHVSFRKFKNPPTRLLKIIDLEETAPLFNMPSCVLIGLKDGTTQYPVLLERYSGELPDRNVKFSKVKAKLSKEVCQYTAPDFQVEPSYYYDKFKVGASIFPRSLYFVDIVSCQNSEVTVKTSPELYHIVKDPWKIVLEGKIEKEFLFATLLAWEIVPFGYLKLRPVILPIREHLNGYELLRVDDLQRYGFTGTAEWLKEAEEIWFKRRTKKSEKRFPSLLDRLNYNNLLSIQSQSKRYVVLYNATGTNLVSCVIDKQSFPYFTVNGEEIRPTGFVVDVKTWFFETENEGEAYYLSSIFNSEIVSKRMKPLQPRGLFGARAIHRRPLLFSISRYDSKNRLHVELAEIGRVAHSRMTRVNSTQKISLRREVRREFKTEIMRINQIVAELKIVEVD